MVPSPPRIIPLLANKCPNNIAPNIPNKILRNPPFCSFASFQLFRWNLLSITQILQDILANIRTPVESVMTQIADQVRVRLISQLLKGISSDTIRHVKTFRIISNEMPVLFFLFYVDDVLVVCKCIQRKILMCTFMNKCFLKSLWQRGTQTSFLRSNNL